MIERICLILLVLFFPISSSVHASTTIDAQIIRNQSGSGSTFVSSGFPVPPGLVTEAIITAGTIKVIVDGSEVAANVTALRGRHSDGTVRSTLIQFTVASMAEGDTLTASIIVDGGERASADPVYVRPTWEIVQNNNVILPTNASYISTTMITFQNLLPAGNGTVDEEEQYTALANDRFDALVAANNDGTARYEEVKGMVAMWARSGDAKYFNYAVKKVGEWVWLDYSTPGSSASPDCNADEYVNPDGRTLTNDTVCGLMPEWNFSKQLSYATMYLMTGYRDFWSMVNYNVQVQQAGRVTSLVTADSNVILKGAGDLPRYNYSRSYGALIAAYMIDASMPMQAQYEPSRALNFEDQFEWVLTAIKNAEWDFEWIAFDTGTGTVPADGTNISQGVVTAELMGVYAIGRYGPKRYEGKGMPATGFLQVSNISGGTFSAGALTGISATATGANETDYRAGYTGTRSNSPLLPNIESITASVSGTTLTVSSIGSGVVVRIGTNISGGGLPNYTYIVSQSSGAANGVGTYELSESTTISSTSFTVNAVIPSFQAVFVTNFLIDYYMLVKADSRIPVMVKKHVDILLKQINQMVPGDAYYGRSDATYGSPVYGKGYKLENPVNRDPDSIAPYDLPEYTRMIAFVLKTLGEDTINGASYATWYSRCIDTANNAPATLTWQWKNFGQFYGWGSDTAWLNAQSSFTAPTFREPTAYANIPSDAPDFARSGMPMAKSPKNEIAPNIVGITLK